MSSLFPGLDTEPWKKSCDECESIESKYACPVYNCSQHGNEAIKWTHGGDCGGGFRLYSNGKEKCQKCGEEDFFCNWNYCCNSDNKNQQFNNSSIRAILQFLVGLNDDNVSEDFWFNLKMCFKKQKKDYPSKFT